MLAVLIGMALRNTLGRPESARSGLALAVRAPLRLGIVLLGLQVTLAEILHIGAGGLALVNRSNNTLGRKVRDVPSGFSSGRV